jgi:hypothetical protein
MSVSIVNGYLCFSACDAAKAATGQNPHPSADAASQASGNAQRRDGPAVILSGALTVSGNAVTALTGANQSNDLTAARNPGTSIDILA